jgi:predicted HAD superfamily Cof-like phosphohydrolase
MKQPVCEDGGDKDINFNSESVKMGIKLIKEEYDELIRDWEAKDLLGIADNTADLVWVLCGFMARLGVDLDKVWGGVRNANTAKLGGPIREDGKLMKPHGWKPPDTRQDILDGRYLEDIT